MAAEAKTHIVVAQEAFAAGDWVAASASFEAALKSTESAEALFGFGNTLWWLGETETSVRHLERAYAASAAARIRPRPSWPRSI